METLELSLTKTVTYKLQPFGRFTFKLSSSTKVKESKGIISIGSISWNYENGMPYTKEDEKAFSKFMIKHKSDVLTDEYRTHFYTRMGDNWTEITHPKLTRYNIFLKANANTDNIDTWTEYLNS